MIRAEMRQERSPPASAPAAEMRRRWDGRRMSPRDEEMDIKTAANFTLYNENFIWANIFEPLLDPKNE